MQRSDMVPLALVAALAGVVGFRVVRHPAASAPVPTVATVSVARSHPTPPPPSPAAPKPAATAKPDTTSTTIAAEPDFPEVFKPNPKSAEILHRLQAGAAGTYIFEMLEGSSSVIRWPVRPTEPIRVWVDPAPRVNDWDPKFAAAARDGFKRWTAAGIPVRMNFVMDSAGAEVKVRWVDKLDDKAVGVTHRFGDKDYWLTSASIELSIHEPGGGVLTREAIRAIASHEAGHMLGLGHSPYELDIMSWNYNRQIEPSVNDLHTMRLLYTIPPGRFR